MDIIPATGYRCDRADREWALIEPLFSPSSVRGRPRRRSVRTALNAIFYVARAGCALRLFPRDYRNVKGRKRHVLVKTDRLLLGLTVHAANIMDRDGVALLLPPATICSQFPRMRRVWLDSPYNGKTKLRSTN